MEHLILGLLLLRSRTIYELREAIDQGLNLMYSSSPGSIQAGLKKLLTCQAVTVSEVMEGKRKKKVYTITETGKTRFADWVETPMDMTSARNPELSKLYFMGFSRKEDRTAHLEAVIRQLEEPYKILSAICRQAETMEVPEQYRDILRYQAASARFGRDFMKFQMDWYQAFLDEEKERT